MRVPNIVWWGSLSPNTQGALWMLCSAFFLSAMSATLKQASLSLNVWQLLLVRSIFALFLLLPALVQGNFCQLRTRVFPLHIMRGCLGTCAFACYFIALSKIELALTVTLGFTRNLFIVIFAIFVLKEIVKWRRITATAIGFSGVLICIQPGSESASLWALLAVGYGFFAASVTIVVKRLTDTESSISVLFYMYCFMGLIAFISAIVNWKPLALMELVMIGRVALFSTAGQMCTVNALRVGETTVVAPFEYTRILYAVIFGFILFGEIAGINTWIGALIIISSTLYISLRNQTNT